MDNIRSGRILACKELIQAMDYIEDKLDDPDVIIRADMIEKAVELIERYFEFKLLDWELFFIALIFFFYKPRAFFVFKFFFIRRGRKREIIFFSPLPFSQLDSPPPPKKKKKEKTQRVHDKTYELACTG